jgi:hypothetical protein
MMAAFYNFPRPFAITAVRASDLVEYRPAGKIF